jgi:8-oxo-dGTP diphosphatase
MSERPKVGTAVFIWRDGKFLMYRRRGSHASGKVSVPGGHLEFGESWEDCVAREALEEVGVTIKNIRFLAVTNDILKDDDKHYISVWMTADWASGKPRIMEPDKVEELSWHTFQDLPDNLFEPCWSNLRAAKPELFV